MAEGVWAWDGVEMTLCWMVLFAFGGRFGTIQALEHWERC